MVLKIWRKFCPTEKAAFSVREHAGHTVKCSVHNSLTYDTRDRPLLATKGVLLKIAQEYASLLGNASFIKHQFDVQVSFFINFFFLTFNAFDFPSKVHYNIELTAFLLSMWLSQNSIFLLTRSGDVHLVTKIMLVFHHSTFLRHRRRYSWVCSWVLHINFLS